MTETVSETIGIISKDVQQVFDDLMKLILRKTLRPTLNPLGSNTITAFNTRTQKYETVIQSSNPDFGINKYNYTMIVECIGWCGDSITTMKAISKISPGNYPERHPQGQLETRNTRLVRNRTVYSTREQKEAAEKKALISRSTTEYKRFIEFISAKNMQNIIANRKSSFAYSCDIPYMDCFKQLANIGDDIVNQTDETINDPGTSTLLLRKKLDKLEGDLYNLFELNQPIYCSYIEMIYIINSIDRSQLQMLINLIAALSYQDWSELDPSEQVRFTTSLGTTFIEQFNANQLITILLQDDASNLILTASYLYSLLKMLFCVFGYTDLTPNLTLDCCESLGCNCQQSSPCDYAKVIYFQMMYPTLIAIISNPECIPSACPEIHCPDIPQTYQDLDCINQYFWRFNDYSYCQYMQYNAEKQMTLSLASKVSTKINFLKAL